MSLDLLFHLLVDVGTLVEGGVPDVLDYAKPFLEFLLFVSFVITVTEYLLEGGHYTGEDSDSEQLNKNTEDHLSFRGRVEVSVTDSGESREHEVHSSPQSLVVIFKVASSQWTEVSLAGWSSQVVRNYKERVFFTIKSRSFLNIIREAVPEESKEEREHDDNENLVDNSHYPDDLLVKSQLVILVVALIELED